MNKQRRKHIQALVEQLRDIKDTVDELHDEEETAMDNMPENTQSGDRWEKMQEAVSDLELAVDSLEEAISYLESAGDE